jgi:DNA repair protein RadC
MTEAKPHHLGHRARLRTRLIEGGAQGLADYELLELILFAASARSDVKPLAKNLMSEFKTLGGVITADINALRNIKGLGDAGIAALHAVQIAAEFTLKERASALPVINSWQALLDYIHFSMGHKKIEQFRVLFLDKKNKLLGDELQSEGTVDHTPVYPREVVKRALELGATALLLVHNHPSGDPTPSEDDIRMTEAIDKAASSLNIRLHDHVIAAKDEYFSFKSHGLL